MDAIKALFSKYSAWLWSVLAPLGPWGVFAIAAVDSAAWGLPLDPIVATYVYQHRSTAWLYVLLASAGSAAGSLVLYGIGYAGGEALLHKRMSPERFERIRSAFDRHEFLTLMLPAMLPPPTPFKLIVLSAAVFEMHFTHFILAIFLGRVLRFTILSVLVLVFGPGVVSLTTTIVKDHLLLVLGGLAVLGAVAAFFYFRRKKKKDGTKDIAA